MFSLLAPQGQAAVYHFTPQIWAKFSKNSLSNKSFYPLWVIFKNNG
jgi:hypothetical protein